MSKIGVIADDFTGATDIAGFLVANGVKTIQTADVPKGSFTAHADAYVVSLKSRSCPSDEAIEQSLNALSWLKKQGCTQFYFKYCSTFDSTVKGNIGPVTDALMDVLGEEFTVVCPALPINGRCVYKGYLFVHDQLLHESGMRNHPITPMTDSHLGRLMEKQSRGRTGHIYTDLIEEGTDAVQDRLRELKAEGVRYGILDSQNQRHLDTLGVALKDMTLVTGGSGLVSGLVKAVRQENTDLTLAQKVGTPGKAKTVILAGSCSEATNRQVDKYKKIATFRVIDGHRCLSDSSYLNEVYQWILEHLDDPLAPLLFSTATTEILKKNREINSDIGDAIEEFFGKLACMLLEGGVEKFIIAGGETSGSVVKSLELSGFYVGPQIDPGVPWVKAVDKNIFLALKSGNFGCDDFFKKSQEMFS